MNAYRAVLFDWVGTLVHLQSRRWRLRRAHEAIGRAYDDDGIEALALALRDAHGLPDVQDAIRVEDHSAAHFRAASLLWFTTAALDPDLADALHAMSSDPRTHPPYPESREVLSSLHGRGVRIGVVSDFSFDLRPAMVEHGFTEFVDAVVISFEHGFQKPDPRMFTTALDLLEVPASETLMVGDRASHDGAAAAVGIDTLILPMPDEVSHPKLRGVGRLALRPDQPGGFEAPTARTRRRAPERREATRAPDGGTPPSGPS